MSRLDGPRVADIIEAIVAVQAHLDRGDLSDGLVYDAVRVRLIDGEAVKGVSEDLLATEPEIR